MNETITISKKEYDSLTRSSAFLEALREAGVDNWDGYSIALQSLEESEE